MPTSKENIGLACAGGIVEGAVYEIGALCALEEAVDGLNLNQLGAYVGISSGSLITACLANNITAKELSQAIVGKSAEANLNIKPEVMFSFALAEYLKRLQVAPQALYKSIKYYWQHPMEWSFWGSVLSLGGLIPSGLFDNSKLEAFARRIFSRHGRTNDFRRLDTNLHIVATKLDTAEVVCFGDDGLKHVPISKAIQASTALPGLYCPVEIGGEHYIDGVARRTVHASAVLDDGVTLLFCVNPIVPINTQAEGPYNKEVNRKLTDYGLPVVMSQTLRTLVSSRMNTGFKRYSSLYPDADLILIEPEVNDFDFFFSNIFSFSNRQRVCEHAYQTTRTFLRKNATTIQSKLAKHGLSLNEAVLQDTSRTLLTKPLEMTSLIKNFSPLNLLGQVEKTVLDVRNRFNI